MNHISKIFLSFIFITCSCVDAQEISPEKEVSPFNKNTWYDVDWSSQNQNWVGGKLFYGPHLIDSYFGLYERNSKDSPSLERELSFKIYPWEKNRRLANSEKTEELFYKEGNAFKPLEIRRSQITPQYSTKITKSTLTLYTRHLGQDGKLTYLPAVEGNIPAAASDVFTILFPSPKPFLYSVNIAKSKFPAGSFIFVNREERDVVVTINGTQKLVKALGEKLFSYKLDEKLLLRIDVTESKEKGALSLVGQTVGGKKGQRIIGVFYKFRKNRSRLFLQREIDSQAMAIPSHQLNKE